MEKTVDTDAAVDTDKKQACNHEYHDDWGEPYSEHLPCVLYN